MNTSKLGFKLIIGLGNPDKKYMNTYHNVGFLAIDYFAKNPPSAKSQTSNYKLLKSDTYMNVSGFFAQRMMKKHGAKPEQLLIIHDDSDILLGEYKLSFSRGAAGHHGVESVIKSLKTNSFWRLRIGIRPPNPADHADKSGPRRNFNLSAMSTKFREVSDKSQRSPRPKAEEFVLKKITAADKKILEQVFQKAATEFE